MLGALKYAACIALTVFWAALGILTWPFSPSGNLYLRYARIWSRMCLRVVGATRLGRPPGRSDRDRPLIFMSNHESIFDIIALFATIPCPIRMLAKKELRRVPILGWSMWMAGFVFVDRGRGRDAFANLARAAAQVRGGKSVVIFPEGTRGNGDALLPFKRGGFTVAVEAGVPVIPVGIAGTAAVLPHHTLRPRSGPIAIVFGDPIEVDPRTPDARKILMKRVREAIEKLVAEARARVARVRG